MNNVAHRRHNRVGLALFALLLAISSSCSLAKGKGAAEAAVARFHEQFNAGKFHEIYEETDDGFKKSASEDDFTALLAAVQRKLGTVKDTHSAGWGVNTTPLGTMATVNYEVDFSEGKGSESFVFRINDDKATLYHYNVNSPLLIIK